MIKKIPYILLFFYTLTIIGAAWDIWNHNRFEVESFWTIYHMLIYFSVAASGLLVLGIVIFECRKIGKFSPYNIPNNKGLALTGTGSIVQLIAGISDELYHRLMGFDVTMWSPPHVAVLFGAIISLLGIFELLRKEVGLKRDLGVILSLSYVILSMTFCIIEFDMNYKNYPYGEEWINWDINARWQPYHIYIGLFLGSIMSYCFTLGVKTIKYPSATLITMFVFIIKYLIMLIWNESTIQLYYPMYYILIGVAFDVSYLFLKKVRGQLYFSNIISAFVIVIVIQIQNPIFKSVHFTDLLFSLLLTVTSSLIFAIIAIKGIFVTRYHLYMFFITVYSFKPLSVIAHEKNEINQKIAPDLHPIFIYVEFIIIFVIGYKLADKLSKIKKT